MHSGLTSPTAENERSGDFSLSRVLISLTEAEQSECRSFLSVWTNGPVYNIDIPGNGYIEYSIPSI